MEQLKGKHKKMQKKMKNTQDQSSEENPDTPQKKQMEPHVAQSLVQHTHNQSKRKNKSTIAHVKYTVQYVTFHLHYDECLAFLQHS